MSENLREIVNAKMLQQFNGKKISITGVVTNVNPNGLTFDIRSVDDVLVKVNLKRPFTNALEGIVEVHGVAQGGGTVICENFVPFPASQIDEFDSASHNTLALLLQSIPDLWKTVENANQMV